MDCKVKWSCAILTLMALVIDKVVMINGQCRVIPEGRNCVYTVACENHPTSVGNPSCDGTPNVTFIISRSYLCSDCALTSGYFSSTNFDSRVRQIIVHSSDWPTLEASAFKYYSKTIYMNLSSIGIVKIHKDAFINLLYLKTLNLSNNKIQNLNFRSLYFSPEAVLETLDLSRNQIASLPNDIFSNMRSLLELNLQENVIADMGDDCFSYLSSLSTLYLQHNKIVSLNLTLMPLRTLKHLDLSHNSIAALKGHETNHLSSLEYLNISNNALEVVEANCFSQALNLRIVDLSNNRIHSTIESFMFMNNKLLEHLDFYHNNISTIKENSFKFNSIKYINFEQNNLTGVINSETLKGLYNVTLLNFSGQNIRTIKNRAFADMAHLKELNLSRNCIETVESSSFEFDDGNSLSVLDMSHNNLVSLHFFQNFTSQLIKLYLNHNKLTKIQNNIFENHKNLEIFDVSYNEIVTIEQKSLPLQSLQYLNITGNRLGGNIMDNIYSPAQFIRYLNLSHFRYKRIDKNAFVNLSLTAKLNISYNELEFVHADNFIGMDNMYSLDLSYNNLEKLELNTSLDNLKTIYLNNNKFTELPRIFSINSSIIHIDMSHNNISDMLNTGVANISNTKILNLSHNKISNFNNNQTNTLTQITFLALGSNQLSEIKLDLFKELTYVDLSSNMIKYMNISMFRGLDALQYLDLSENKISEISPGTFQDLKVLKLLNLSSNYLTTLRYGSFRGLNKTDVLDLSRNKLTSVDIYIFHECVELRILLIDYNFIKSVDVERLPAVVPRLSVLSLGGNPMACEEIVRTLQNKNRSITVTAIHKIYHEDNVHGIKCGVGSDNISETESVLIKHTDDDHVTKGNEASSINNLTLIWCSILTVICFVVAAVVFYHKRDRNRKSIMQLRNSLNIGNINCDRDLLS